ncbi:MAG: hypothetical protein HYX69_12335 [Planctomycetia bacterium]|nr:hypothetical protein [Planctomycetia bacterium]
MTLTPFPPATLDELALRLLDVAAAVRKMANSARENGLGDFQLHGNKAQEWLDKLEDWARDSEGRLAREIHRQKGVRRAQSPPDRSSRPADRKRAPTRRKGE